MGASTIPEDKSEHRRHQGHLHPVRVRVHLKVAFCARTKQLVTRRSQLCTHLLSPTPAPGLLQNPMQFANRSSHCASSVTACADELSAPMPIKVIAKKKCRTMVETP
jgi:hypothetical protein